MRQDPAERALVAEDVGDVAVLAVVVLLSAFDRERLVVLLNVASSSIATCTVTMSPILAARWSLKKALAPGRHSELGWRLTLAVSGIGMLTAR